ncbi:hypothetical protein OU800_04520 [Pseudomonas sp. GOM7]|uniref:hypothetical protein n=1 Tax=unclassified Pseudomonas TaxID=196821 RepID=UPI00227A4DC0|nr:MULTISPECIES: hypothetical protein [unclassified Pseudomonas]WAJ38506.1 hypothetical protein OU800_04520 [Pseudomonas sp. GOM7]
MSLQAFWALLLAYPAMAINGLALFFAVAGGWLWVMTRLREQRGLARMLTEGEGQEMVDGFDARTLRINRFFYQFGALCLLGALLLSWYSTRL